MDYKLVLPYSPLRYHDIEICSSCTHIGANSMDPGLVLARYRAARNGENSLVEELQNDTETPQKRYQTFTHLSPPGCHSLICVIDRTNSIEIGQTAEQIRCQRLW